MRTQPSSGSASPPGRRTSPALWGLAAALTLMGAAMAVPAVTGWNVHVRSFPPLHAEWDPRLGLATLFVLALAAVGLRAASTWAEELPWGRLLLATYLGGLAWALALALVDGPDGIGEILQTPYEYLGTARSTTDLHATLQEYVSRIGFDAEPDNWPVHIAGHPPGALLFFVALVRLGLGGGLAAGLVVTALAATAPLAVLSCARTLGAETIARRAAPFLVLGPAAIWQAVSADALFAAVGAWGIALLAVATRRRGAAQGTVAALAGILLGYTVMMSYGLPLLGILALAVLVLGRSWRPLPVAAATALAVVLVFAALGFRYWEALPELHQRYWDGVASRRPPQYWMWGNLAALMFSAGPLAGAALAHLLASVRAHLRGTAARAAAGLALAGWAMVAAADLSQMSRAEVERIWLPFVPWLLLGCGFLPDRWRRWGLAGQVLVALAVQHLLFTGW